MLRSLLAGISGLRHHQLRLDVIGNNIANVNTTGYKAARVNAQEGFAQMLANAAGGNGATANPSQVGTGVRSGTVEAVWTQGTIEATGQPLDLAISGGGFFALHNGDRLAYTRAGQFQIDAEGRLVLAGTNGVLQGIRSSKDGLTAGSVGDLVLSLNELSAPQATTEVRLSGNLDSSAEIGDTRVLTVTAYDATGATCPLTFAFEYQGAGAWEWTASTDESTTAPETAGSMTFDESGDLTELTYPDGAGALTLIRSNGQEITIQVLTETQEGDSTLTNFAGSSTLSAQSQDGYPAGSLINLQIDESGLIEGLYSNGTQRTLGRIALAVFENASGLVRGGGTMYEESASSGAAIFGFAGEGMAAEIYSGALESSNVDLTDQFTQMIVAQRGFQANARMITTSDELLAELINLRR